MNRARSIVGGLVTVLFLGVSNALAGFDGDPLYINTTNEAGHCFYAWRPFYSHYEEEERWRKDYLWPLYTRKGFKDETYSRLLFFGYSNDFSESDGRHRQWILPFWYAGEDKHGESYWALWPLYGTIHEFLGRDKIFFAAWPIYTSSEINEVRAKSILWPIYSKVEGDRVSRYRIWPLYGRASLEGQFNKKFVLWPIYNQVEYTSEKNPGGGFVLFPLYGRIKTEHADNQWYIPPFGRYATSEDQWIVHAPWPFIQLADGVMYKRIFWPLYGTKKLGTLQRTYLLWPILWNNRTTYAYDTQYRKLAVPFFAYEKNVITKEHGELKVGDVTSRYWKIWPLMSWERNGEASRFRTLELWPLRDTPGVERNWAPWWSLYKRINLDGDVGHHLLWGLYRQQQEEDQFEWSLLKGFAGYKRTLSHKEYRFLFIRFGGKSREDAP
jgi:hypothetical protein